MNTLYIWPIEPNWVSGMTETLEWKTDLLQSHSGAEQRIAQRFTPRRTFEFSILLAGTARQQFENWLCYLGGSDIYMPIFTDIYQVKSEIKQGVNTLLIDTVGRDIHVGSKLLIKSGFEFSSSIVVEVKSVSIGSVELTIPLSQPIVSGAFIYPLRKAIITDMPVLERANDNVFSAQIRLRISEHNQHSENIDFLSFYQGRPVLDILPDWSESVTGKYDRLMLELDNGSGIPVRTDTARRAFYINTLQYEALGRDEQSHMRQILYYLRGRQKPIWVSSHTDDLSAVSNIAGSQLDIVNVGYSLAGTHQARRHICITLKDGTQHYASIIGAAVMSNNIERLVLDNTMLSIDKSDILKISFLTLSRLNSDQVKYEHLTDGDGFSTVTLDFWGLNDELE